jgi:hypothetical protein
MINPEHYERATSTERESPDENQIVESEWICGAPDGCGEPALEGPDEVPRCANPRCNYYGSVVPNYRHEL